MAAKIILYVFPGNEYTLSVDPESLQILTYLRFLEDSTSIQVIKTCNHWQLSTGVFPTLVVDGVSYTGVDVIIKQLKKQGLDIDNRILMETQLAEVTAYHSLLNDHLKLTLLYLHWLDGKNYTEITRKWIGQMASFPFSLYILSQRYKQAKNAIKTSLLNLSNKPEQQEIELINRAEEGLEFLAAKLQNNKFFFGTKKPSSLDALVFGYLELIAQYPLPSNNQLRLKLRSLSSLLKFCSTVRETYFPEMKTRSISVSNVSGPLVPIYKDRTVWICVGVALTLLMLQGVRVGLFKRITNK